MSATGSKTYLDAISPTDIKNIYSESRVVEFDDYVKKKRRFRHTDLHWGQIPRANNPKKPLQSKAVNLLSTIVHKLRKNEVVTLNQNYLSRITNCAKDQNINLLKQIANVLDISFHAKIVINDKIYRNYYVIKHTQNGKEIIENTEVLLAQKHFVGKIAITPIINKPTEDKKDSARVEFIRTPYIYKEEAFKKERYIPHALESISCNNSNINHPTNNSESVDIKKMVSKESVIIATDTQTKPSVVSLQNKHRAPNKRKKPLKSAKIIRPTFYSKPKSLGQMHDLLDQNTCAELRFSSGRDFSNNFISQKVLALSKKPELIASFKTKQGYISYMTTVLQREMHDPVKTAGNNFRLRINLTSEDIQYRTQEKLLNEVEQQAITHVCPENQLKAKIAGRLEGGKAYQLLSNLKRFEIVEDVIKIHLTKQLELTENDKEIILSQAKAVYSTASGISVECVERVEFVVSANNNIIQQIYLNPTHQGVKHESPPLELPKGIWGEISQKLIEEIGVDSYRNWLSKLTAKVDEEGKTIILKAPSEFAKDWITSHYQGIIERIIKAVGFELTNLECCF